MRYMCLVCDFPPSLLHVLCPSHVSANVDVSLLPVKQLSCAVTHKLLRIVSFDILTVIAWNPVNHITLTIWLHRVFSISCKLGDGLNSILICCSDKSHLNSPSHRGC